MAGLSDTEERFAREYALDLNATAAYFRLFPNVKRASARASGARMLARKRVRQLIAHGAERVSETNSVRNSGARRSGPRGGQLRSGNPGNRGGGRLPKTVHERCRALADIWVGTAHKIVKDRSDPAFTRVGQIALEYGYGKPVQAVEVDAGPTPYVVRFEHVYLPPREPDRE